MKKLLRKVAKKELLGIINSFKKVTGYKTKIQKLILLLHTNSEHPKIVIKNTVNINNSIHKHEMLKNKQNIGKIYILNDIDEKD